MGSTGVQEIGWNQPYWAAVAAVAVTVVEGGMPVGIAAVRSPQRPQRPQRSD